MNSINVLDCTLRDGGYCNQWNFGFNNMKKIVKSLVDANIDIIECGFLTNRVLPDVNISKFTAIKELAEILPMQTQDKLFVAMLNFGEYDVKNLPECDGLSIQGIRVAFHKRNRYEALELCRKIQNKGYKVFVQAMVSMSYTDEEFLELIHMINEVEPYAFYIVDSFGMMKKKDLIRLFYMVEHNLKDNVWIGFHSHNNLQLAYSNAQCLVEAQTKRNLIIDSSIYGMGRGAGNLNTELFIDYLNETVGAKYVLKPLLNVIDEVLSDFHEKDCWGYSLPNYLSAVHTIHPNYAGYLSDKNTLTVEAMDEIFSMMEMDKCVEFDKQYIEKVYIQYMASGKTYKKHLYEFEKLVVGKKILLIAPGKSAFREKNQILDFVLNNNVLSISINFDYQFMDTDFIFVSNLRRFRDLDIRKHQKTIITSNISANDVYIRTEYSDLLNTVDMVRDNAGMMAIKWIINLGVKEVYLAGFDGYSHDLQENYGSQKMTWILKNSILDSMNQGMARVLENYSEAIDIHFVTTSRFIENSSIKNFI